MTSPNLDFAMRLSADLGDAAQEVAQLDAALDKVQGAGANAAKGLNSAATASSAAAAANTKSTTAANANATALNKQAAAANTAARANTAAANSAKQNAQAMRQLPMQITDIFTGLASGQNPLMVLIQQGGQLKDSFGGVVPAGRALLGALSPMVLVGGAVAAALGSVAVGAVQGYQEIRNLERALISTGNVAGVTAGQVADMADRVGDATGEFGDADKAAAQLAASGKLSGDTLEDAMTAAVNLAKLTGESIEETTNKIIELAESPSAMLLKLNDQYHFLTAEVYDHVKSLEEQGRAEDAAKVAVEAFATVHEQRIKEAQERAGWLEKAWVGLGNTISSIWDSIKSIGRDDAEARVRAAEANLSDYRMRQAARSFPISDAIVAQYQAEIDAAKAALKGEQERAAAEGKARAAEDAKLKQRQAAEKAGEEWDRLRTSNLSKQQKLEQEIANIRKLGVTAGKSQAEIDAQIAQAQARYQESLPKGRKERTGKTDAQKDEEAAQREIENLTKQTAMLGLVEDGEKRVSEEARIRWEIENGAYKSATAASQQQLIAQAQALDAARKAADEQAKQKKELEDTERAYERLHDRLRTPVEAAVETVTDQIETLNKALKSGVIDAKQYKAEIAKLGRQALSPLPNFRDELYQFGVGSPDDDRLNEQLSQLQDEYDQRRAVITAALRQENADKEYWNQQSILLEQQHQEALTNLAIAQNQLRLAQASDAFGSMASIAKSFAGEQSKTYRALFALSKGFAVAQAAVALAQNVAEASKLGWPANIGAIAAAMAQGAQIAQLLSSANYSPGGYAEGGYTGPGGKYQPAGIVHKGEGVLSQEDIRALGGPRGFHALRAAIHNGYAEGGLVAPAPVYSMPEPRARISDSNAMQTSVNNKMRVYLLQNEDQLAQRLAQHPAMEKAVVAIAGQNGGAIRADW